MNQRRSIVDRHDLQALRQAGFHIFEALLDSIDDSQGITAVAHDHDSAYGKTFAVEFGYTDLGTVESVITGAVADFDQFLKDVADIHPFLGEGVTLSAVWYPIQTDSMVALIRVGGWYWEADVDIRAASGERIEIDEDGIDLLFGVGAIWNVAEDLSFRAEYERYIIDHENADFFTLGIQYDLNWRL